MKKIETPFGNIPVVSDEEAEKSDYLICMPANTPSPFTDNLTGYCSHCGVKVHFRWHAPRKPKRLCMDCCLAKIEGKP